MKFNLCRDYELCITFHIHYIFSTVPIASYANLHFPVLFQEHPVIAAMHLHRQFSEKS